MNSLSPIYSSRHNLLTSSSREGVQCFIASNILIELSTLSLIHSMRSGSMVSFLTSLGGDCSMWFSSFLVFLRLRATE